VREKSLQRSGFKRERSEYSEGKGRVFRSEDFSRKKNDLQERIAQGPRLDMWGRRGCKSEKGGEGRQELFSKGGREGKEERKIWGLFDRFGEEGASASACQGHKGADGQTNRLEILAKKCLERHALKSNCRVCSIPYSTSIQVKDKVVQRTLFQPYTTETTGTGGGSKKRKSPNLVYRPGEKNKARTKKDEDKNKQSVALHLHARGGKN